MIPRRLDLAAAMAKWARIRAGGRSRFILLRGLLAWGGTMFVLMGLGFSGLMLGAVAYTPKWLALNAALWTSGGLMFGALTWYQNEKLYHRHKAATAGEIA
ncbi:hypothetical protein [Arenimonas composti]|uniref:Uncharacterized protein n=1 Tax=Arenimonas composti TR7-09 = DSM 18010 TaxID=1121013 RepID=A0A091BXA0_9GAMM|nr:hypothetical protein [Arenimonas composti]KFN48945.1 hypothetical protein P873_01195 [Arenimonas composti TR7-09 = DSM 18010]